MINTLVTIGDNDFVDVPKVKVQRAIGETNATSSFTVNFDTPYGRHATDFAINDEIIIKADIDTSPAETKIFTGIIENIDFKGDGNKENLVLNGRDFGAVLQDIMVSPRVFKSQEVSTIVTDIMSQNVSSSIITTNNVNVTATTLDKITFTNISVFDALKKLAEASNFIFFIDEDKDLNFTEKSAVSSTLTLDNTNVFSGDFSTRDRDVFNRVQVFGARSLTGVRQIFTKGTDNTGSVYVLTDKPHDMVVTTSGAENVVLSPGGISSLNNPSTENVKYLVDFQGQTVTLTSGTTAGDNIQAVGSVVIMDYQRSTPLIGFKEDIASQQAFGRKDKIITDLNIRSPEEATDRAVTFLSEHKDPKIQGQLLLNGLVGSITVGQTAIVNLPNYDQSNITYDIIQATYNFTPSTIQSQQVITLDLNKKQVDFVDTMKDQILRLRAVEASQQDANVTVFNSSLGSIGVSGIHVAVSRSIGSAFYFHTSGHNLLNHPAALLGDVRVGSIVLPLQ